MTHPTKPERRLLMVAHSFPPIMTAGERRPRKLAKYLSCNGFAPTVLAPEPSPDLAPRRKSFIDSSVLSDLKNCDIVRCPNSRIAETLLRGVKYLKLHELAVLLARPDERTVLWRRNAQSLAKRLHRERCFHAVWTTYPPAGTLAVGQFLKQRFRVPWIIDYRDPWTTCDCLVWPTKMHFYIDRKWEHRYVQNADAICVTTPLMKARLRESFNLDDRKIHVIENGYDIDDLPVERIAPRRDSNVIVIRYCGRLQPHDWSSTRLYGRLGEHILGRFKYTSHGVDYSTHSPGPLLHALSRVLKDTPEARQHIRVELAGRCCESNRSLVQSLGLSDLVSLSPFLPHREAMQFITEADVLFLPLRSPLNGKEEVTYPGKLFEYIAARRPILAIAPKGDLQRLIARANLGWCVDPYDGDAICCILRKLISFAKAGQRPPYCPSEEIIAEFDFRRIAAKLARVLETVASPS